MQARKATVLRSHGRCDADGHDILRQRQRLFPMCLSMATAFPTPGNIYAATVGGTIPQSPPYYNGRFSNGILADEYLANALHAPLTSFAWGSATTGIGAIGRRRHADVAWASSELAWNAAAGAGFTGQRSRR